MVYKHNNHALSYAVSPAPSILPTVHSVRSWFDLPSVHQGFANILRFAIMDRWAMGSGYNGEDSFGTVLGNRLRG